MRGWRWSTRRWRRSVHGCRPKAAVEARRSLKQNPTRASVVGQHQLLRVRLERVGGAYLIKHELGGVFDVVVLGEQLDVLLDYLLCLLWRQPLGCSCRIVRLQSRTLRGSLSVLGLEVTHKQGGENLRKNKFGFGDLGLELLDAARRKWCQRRLDRGGCGRWIRLRRSLRQTAKWTESSLEDCCRLVPPRGGSQPRTLPFRR